MASNTTISTAVSTTMAPRRLEEGVTQNHCHSVPSEISPPIHEVASQWKLASAAWRSAPAETSNTSDGFAISPQTHGFASRPHDRFAFID